MRLHLRHSDDLLNTHSSSQSIDRIINATAVLVFDQQKLGKQIFGSEESRIARALVLLTRLYGCTNNTLSNRVVIRSAVSSNLVILAAFDSVLDGIHVVILQNRTDVLLIDLVVRGQLTTIAKQHCSSKFSIQLTTHFSTLPSHHIEIGNIDDIITIHLHLDVYSGRASGTLQDGQSKILLHITLNIAPGTSFILVESSKHRLNSRERSVVDRTHYLRNPAIIFLDPLGRGVQRLGLRKQVIVVGNIVGGGMLQKTFLQTAITLSIGNNIVENFGMSQSFILLIGIGVKHIVLHIFISLFHFIVFVIFVIFITIALKGLTNKSINYSFLLFGKGVEYILYRLFATLSHRFSFLLYTFCMA